MQMKTKVVYPYANTRITLVKIATILDAYIDAEVTVDIWENGKSIAACIL